MVYIYLSTQITLILYMHAQASLKERLRVAESRNTQLEEEKATIALEVEKKVIAETAKLVVCFVQYSNILYVCFTVSLNCNPE